LDEKNEKCDEDIIWEMDDVDLAIAQLLLPRYVI